MGRIMFEGAGLGEITHPDDRQRLGTILTAWVKLNEAVFMQVREEVPNSTAYSLLGARITGSRYVRESWSGIRPEVTEDFARFFEARYGIALAP